MPDSDVLVVGAGPVGLVLAIDLARRGVRVQLIERNATCRQLPKMERCNARTMEMFRRMGLAERVRDASLFRDIPMDIFIVTSLIDPPILHLPYPSVVACQAETRACNDGTLPLEPYQLISQYTLEPLLKAVAESMPNISVRFACELVAFSQNADGVEAIVQPVGSGRETMRARYMVGCDGGSSTVRKQLGIKLEGQGRLRQIHQTFLRSDELFKKIPIGTGRHYYFPTGTLVVQDDLRHFMVNRAKPNDAADPVRSIREFLGLDVDLEVLHQGSWNQHLLVAESYGDRRVFLAGDSVHLVIPNGGLGMNTGVGDAIDLAWKLAATIQGWGGEAMLPAYESERRPIGLRNRLASGRAAQGVRSWMAACTADIALDTPAGRAERAKVRELANVGQRISHEMVGTELGYRYDASPLICGEAGERPEDLALEYRPTTWPGARLPHMWLADGTALHDRLGDGFTLLRIGAGTCVDTGALERAMRAAGAPFIVVDVDEPGLRRVYERDLLLLRPDLHVVWRGDEAPADPDRIASVVTGRTVTHHSREETNNVETADA
ncbi:MAG: FAD-dependent monooxygenase [Reyranella sp.]|uniref:FAD-dependent monooxygenase n=1 Tax=Reyranella sp. TaxID=1929291 RepID=UPI002730F3F9|nr:FAD-dependent monooxygenase [Reyranella sp.]MDP1963087.1 FAD-dependent monooxygenase [Reyranella sp.]MDP2378767.1 FAD-dependent monooxygenase [Reyranella sp.]